MPLTFKLDRSIVSLKCSTSVSAVMSRSKLTKVAAVESLVYAAASLVPGTIGFPAVSFTSPEVNRKNVVFAALASVAGVSAALAVYFQLRLATFAESLKGSSSSLVSLGADRLLS